MQSIQALDLDRGQGVTSAWNGPLTVPCPPASALTGLSYCQGINYVACAVLEAVMAAEGHSKGRHQTIHQGIMPEGTCSIAPTRARATHRDRALTLCFLQRLLRGPALRMHDCYCSGLPRV